VAFAVFFSAVLILTRLSPLSWQRVLLLLASFVFYGYWDWRFLPLLWTAIIIDYYAAHRIAPESGNSDADRKYWFAGCVIAQLAMLGFFKYSNFVLGSVDSVFATLGWNSSQQHLDIILPLGISFYTFKTLTYTTDVYRGHLKPTRRLVDYALHVSFFPTIVAGPIERAKNFLPQLLSLNRAAKEQMLEGMHLILWGLFKKVFVADNIALLVNQVFGKAEPSGFEALIGAYGFALQIFCDFSGYTDLARGCAKCLGIELSENFRQPYLALSPSDFWQRWHITLSTWLRDYIFLPLGGAFKSLPNAYRNLAITMTLAGLWHGASWTFVLWGVYWALLLIGHRILQPVMKHNGGWFRHHLPKTARKTIKILVTAQLVCFGWLLFRSESLGQVWTMTTSLLQWQGAVDLSLLLPLLKFGGLYLLVETALMTVGIESVYRLPRSLVWIKTIVYAVLFYFTAFYGSGAETFIYAQF